MKITNTRPVPTLADQIALTIPHRKRILKSWQTSTSIETTTPSACTTQTVDGTTELLKRALIKL